MCLIYIYIPAYFETDISYLVERVISAVREEGGYWEKYQW
jgi:hypothetical protein